MFCPVTFIQDDAPASLKPKKSAANKKVLTPEQKAKKAAQAKARRDKARSEAQKNKKEE